ncbi:RDD family protein [Nibricoccus sp. IMCC34717]|uniref:RDD family protein n=1 Tax=Nibricoccus sp. IMCC34717 TaxID=3034021 RepID=UPI00384BC15A
MTLVRLLLATLLLSLGLPGSARAFTLLLEAEKSQPAETAIAAPEAPPAPPAPPVGAAPSASEAQASHAEHEEHAAAAEEAAERAASGEPSEGDESGEGDDVQHSDSVVMTFFQDALVSSDQRVRTAMAMRGNTVVDGHVEEACMAYAGNTTVNGSSGGPVLAFFGNVQLNGRAENEVICIFGDVTLGPKAYVGGQVVVIGGQLVRSPGAQVRGQVVNLAIVPGSPDLRGIQAWVRDALFFGRPLCFSRAASWTWWIAAAFLSLYLIIGLVAPRAVLRCVETLETRPGRTLLATVLSAFLMPLIFVLLIVTLIGAPVFAFFALACAIFGKAAFLVWLGRRFGLKAPVLALLAGGVLLLLLYLIPVVGGLILLFSTGLSVGMAVYTLILVTRRERKPAAAAAASASPFVAGPPPMPAPTPATSSDVPAPDAGAMGIHAPTSVPTPATLADFGATPPPPPPVAPPPPLRAAPAPAVEDPTTAERAGFMIRLGASAIDIIVVAIALSALHLGGFGVLAFTTYCVVLWVLRGATIGGIICGIRVVRLDGQPLDWVSGIVRALGAFVSLAVFGLGFLWVAFDDEAQSWHDRIAGTTIIRTRSRKGLV